jgi:hypothetical protein
MVGSDAFLIEALSLVVDDRGTRFPLALWGAVAAVSQDTTGSSYSRPSDRYVAHRTDAGTAKLLPRANQERGIEPVTHGRETGRSPVNLSAHQVAKERDRAPSCHIWTIYTR